MEEDTCKCRYESRRRSNIQKELVSRFILREFGVVCFLQIRVFLYVWYFQKGIHFFAENLILFSGNVNVRDYKTEKTLHWKLLRCPTIHYYNRCVM